MSRIVFQIKITPELKAALAGLAVKSNRSVANYVETLLREIVERETGEPLPVNGLPPPPKRGQGRPRKAAEVQP